MAGAGQVNRLEQEGRDLVERLGGRWTLAGGMCRCPAHDDRTPSLSVRAGRSRLLLHCFAGCPAADVLREIQSQGLLVPGVAEVSNIPNDSLGGARRAAALRIWNGARAIAGTPAEIYLRERGIKTSSPQLRYHPRTPHGSPPLTRYRPALIAAVRDEAELVGIHRTFLDAGSVRGGEGGRRCGLGRFGRGAVRLGGATARLGLAEGIETALSVTALFGTPCWATLGTERFRLVALPRGVSQLLLFLDHDQAGRRAEALAREAFANVQIEAHYPPGPGDDWNDVLRAAVSAGRMTGEGWGCG